MTKIMTNQELISRFRELYNEPNFYGSGGNQWSTWQSGKGWYVDCTCSIKAILWGGRFIEANRGKAHAGCKYLSNDVPDFTPASCVKWTGATKGNFKNLIPGEILLMTSHSHAGLYIGNGQVMEVTPAWTGGTPGCQISQIGVNGERFKNGVRTSASWEYHGKLPVIDYVAQPAPTPQPTPAPTPSDKFNIGDKVVLNGPIYVSSNATKAANTISNKVTNITRKAAGTAHPYNTTGDLGWCDESSLTKYVEPAPQPTPAPTPAPTSLKVGDTVEITGTGYSNIYGTKGRTAYGLGWTRKILRVWDGKAYPYQVGDNTGTTGFYKASSLRKK